MHGYGADRTSAARGGPRAACGRRAALVLALGSVVLAAAADAFAHGGEFSPPPIYRPPRERPPVKKPAETPGATTPDSAPPETATTVDEDPKLGRDEWPDWWLVHRRRLLPARLALPQTVSPGAPSAVPERAAAIAALRRATADPDDDVATAAFVALGRAGDTASEGILIAALTSPNRTQTVRESAACGLALLGRTAAPEPARQALDAVALASEAPGRLRAIAVHALGLRGDVESAEVISGLALSARTDAQTACAAASSLGALAARGAPGAGETLLLLAEKGRADDPDPVLVRVHAIQGLARRRDAAATPLLLRLALDAEPGIRRAALLAAGGLAAGDDAKVQSALRRRLDTDRDLGVREAACVALGVQAHPDSRGVLEDALRGGRAVHESFAATALGLWARRNRDAAGASAVRLHVAPGRRSVERAAACAGVAFAGDRAAGPLLLRIAEGRNDPFLRGVAAAVAPLAAERGEASEVLRRLLGPFEPAEVRREAATALGVLGDTTASPGLSQIADGGDRLFVRAAATVALGRIGGPGAAAKLTSIVERPTAEPILRALSAVGLGILLEAPARPQLADVTEDLDWRYATEAIAEVVGIL